MADHIPEVATARKLAEVVARYLDPKWLTPACLEQVMGKVVAHRGVFRTAFDDLDADPKRLPDDDFRLQQQATPNLDDVDWWREHVHHLKAEYDEAATTLRRVIASRTEPLFDRDEAGADEDDRRISQARADEKAADAAPGI